MKSTADKWGLPPGKKRAGGVKFAQENGQPNGRYGPSAQNAGRSRDDYNKHREDEACAKISAAINELIGRMEFPTGRLVSKVSGCAANSFVNPVYRKLLHDGQREFLERWPHIEVKESSFITLEPETQEGNGSPCACDCRCDELRRRVRKLETDLKAEKALTAMLESAPAPLIKKFGLS